MLQTPEPVINAPALDRAAINKENAQHSTGPVTTEGKERVRLNALKTGIYSKMLFLPGEQREAYDAIGEMLLGIYPVKTKEELDLLTDIQNATWLHKRITCLHITSLHIAADERLPKVQEEHPGLPAEKQQALAETTAYF